METLASSPLLWPDSFPSTAPGVGVCRDGVAVMVGVRGCGAGGLVVVVGCGILLGPEGTNRVSPGGVGFGLSVDRPVLDVKPAFLW